MPDIDRTNAAIILAAVILVAVVVVPRVYPPAKHGPQCSELAPPLGGNNRSILALSGSDQQNLDLNLSLETTSVEASNAIQVRLTFVNNDVGPVILYLNTDQMILRGTGQSVPGVSFEITRVNGGGAVSGPVAPAAPPATFPKEQLHLLGSRARCSENFELSPTQYSALGLVPGEEYRIRAFYQNAQPGIAAHPLDATATPAYFDQGVWTGEISSEEVRFEILLPGQPASGS